MTDSRFSSSSGNIFGSTVDSGNSSYTDVFRIMLVEDSEHDAIAFRRALAKSDAVWEITHLERAEGALDSLASASGNWDIIVSDFKLPGMNGLEFCGKALKMASDTPLVMLTGGGSERLAVEALKMGVYDYIIKDPRQAYLELIPVILPRIITKFRQGIEKTMAERALAQNERLLRGIMDVAWDMVIFTGINGESFRFVSSSARTVTGFSSDVFMQGGIAFLMERMHRTDRKEYRPPCSSPGSADICVQEYRFIKSDDQWIHLREARSAILDDSGNLAGVVSTLMDVTAAREAVDRQKLHERLTGALEMAGATCHEMNQPLQAVMGYAELLLLDLPKGSSGSDIARSILDMVTRMGEITRKIMSLTKYVTRDYIKGRKIIDLDRASADSIDEPDDSEK
ncbi:MAG: hypothetical protein CVV64_19410 [Candidatus Wallbacteria bacterium HGW-Wallbacteria-1]|jgi:PAS domain S-box-containing protein|uniref:Response regulatory domain-containing protein n=1 Tax=Candidatus Wallbacteria bacterium HGW-Wallbacteria-1 TaxID=2013854 RepID=A0A2N1PJ31_9BACT|nr:MAG: hypothetical protein CVV64_19410 [Candidatus Wallbacteria bacterium HGW-Wallbacteria-1]